MIWMSVCPKDSGWFSTSTNRLDNGVIEFGAVLTPVTTGVLRLSLSSANHLQGSGGDTRKLGLPFVQLRARPNLPMTSAS